MIFADFLTSDVGNVGNPLAESVRSNPGKSCVAVATMTAFCRNLRREVCTGSMP